MQYRVAPQELERMLRQEIIEEKEMLAKYREILKEIDEGRKTEAQAGYNRVELEYKIGKAFGEICGLEKALLFSGLDTKRRRERS